jgi:hypothetical protein
MVNSSHLGQAYVAWYTMAPALVVDVGYTQPSLVPRHYCFIMINRTWARPGMRMKNALSEASRAHNMIIHSK